MLSMHLKIFATKIDRLRYHFVIFEILLSTMINFLSSYLVVSIYNSPLFYMHLNRIEYFVLIPAMKFLAFIGIMTDIHYKNYYDLFIFFVSWKVYLTCREWHVNSTKGLSILFRASEAEMLRITSLVHATHRFLSSTFRGVDTYIFRYKAFPTNEIFANDQ